MHPPLLISWRAQPSTTDRRRPRPNSRLRTTDKSSDALNPRFAALLKFTSIAPSIGKTQIKAIRPPRREFRVRPWHHNPKPCAKFSSSSSTIDPQSRIQNSRQKLLSLTLCPKPWKQQWTNPVLSNFWTPPRARQRKTRSRLPRYPRPATLEDRQNQT